MELTIKKERSLDLMQGAWLGLSHNSQEAYKYDYNLFFSIIKKNPENITPGDIMEFLNELEKRNYKAASINRKVASISKLFKVLQAAGRIEENPVEQLKNVKRLNRSVSGDVIISLTIEDIRKATELKSSMAEKQLSTIIKILAQTGLRISELINIKYNDIEPHDKNIYKIRIIGKGKKERFIYLPKTEIKTIEKLWLKIISIPDHHDYIFYNYNHDKYCRKYLWREIKIRFKNTVDKDVHPHLLRHFFITYKISIEKKDIKAVSKYAGHANVSTTLNMYVDTPLDAVDAGIVI